MSAVEVRRTPNDDPDAEIEAECECGKKMPLREAENHAARVHKAATMKLSNVPGRWPHEFEVAP